MKVADVIVWDIETGGFKKEEHGLVEIAMIVLDSETLEEKDRYEAIIAPYDIPTPRVNDKKEPLDQGNNLCSETLLPQAIDIKLSQYTSGAQAIHGITMKQINNGKDAKTVAREIKAFCLKHKKALRGGNGKVVSAGHNIVKFDIPYLTFFLNLFKINYKDLFNMLEIDTLLWTRMRWAVDGSISNHKLGTACQMAGIQLIDAHRAMADVEGNADLVRSFLRSLRQQGQVSQQTKKKFRHNFKY